MKLTAAEFAAIAPLLALTVGALVVLVLDVLAGALVPIAGAAAFLAALALAAARWGETGATAFDGLFVADGLTLAAGGIATVAALLSWWGTRRTFEPAREKRGEFLALHLLAPVGMFLLAGARHALVLVLGIETLSVAFYVLAAFDRGRLESVEAGLKYFLLGSLAAAVLLYGGALLFGASGSFSLDLPPGSSPMRTAAACLLLAGLLFKMSAAPFHFWTPDVYEGAPTGVVGFFAAGTKAAALAALLRWTAILPEPQTLLTAAALLTLLVGNGAALVQDRVKRLLAYSAIAHGGVLLLGAAAAASGGAEAVRAAVFYLVAYAPMTVGAFALLGLLEAESGPLTLQSLRGLGRRRPLVAAGLAFFLVSLGGLPPTGGFFAKLFVFGAAVRAGLVLPTVAAVLLSLVGFAAYLRVVGAALLSTPPERAPAPAARPRLGSVLVAGVCAAAVFVLGILPDGTLEALAALPAVGR